MAKEGKGGERIIKCLNVSLFIQTSRTQSHRLEGLQIINLFLPAVEAGRLRPRHQCDGGPLLLHTHGGRELL